MTDTMEQTSSEKLLAAITETHRRVGRTICGARSIPLVHHHGTESDHNPGPLRRLRCTQEDHHEGPHQDAICCWHFQTFEDWQVESREPHEHDTCESCQRSWPCPTIEAIQEAL